MTVTADYEHVTRLWNGARRAESQYITSLEQVGDDISLTLGRESPSDEDTGDDREDQCNQEDGLEYPIDVSRIPAAAGLGDLRRDDLDPFNVPSFGSCDYVRVTDMCLAINVSTINLVRPDIDVVRSLLHVSLPEIDERVDEKEG
jgi:hypothetical protein